LIRRRLIPTDIVARILGVKPGTVRMLAQRGQLTRYGTARHRMYDLAEVVELLRRRDTGQPACGNDQPV